MKTANLLPGITLLLLAALQSFGATAASRADEILEKLAAGFRAMGSYEVDFQVTAGEYRAGGRYAVEGERYSLTLGDAEVFCDGATRYEIDNARREVTMDEVDTTSRNLLNNPVHAFDFLGTAYTASLAWERGGQAAVTLTPSDKQAAASGTVTVAVSTATMRPLSLTYNFDGERVEVTIERIAPLDKPLETFDKGAYAGYEFIDFR